MPRGPQRAQQPQLGQLASQIAQYSSQRGVRPAAWENRPEWWGGAAESGPAEGQASWTNVDAPRYTRRPLGGDNPRQQWLKAQAGLSWGKHAANAAGRRQGRQARRGGRGPAPAPQQQPGPQGPAGALPAAGQTTPWSGGRPMPQAGTPAGTTPQGPYGSPTPPGPQPALSVGGSTADNNYRPPIPMRQKTTTTIHRTVGGRTPGRIDYSGAIEATATDIPKASSGIPTPSGGEEGDIWTESPRKPGSGDASRPKTYTAEQRAKMDKRNAQAKERRARGKTAVETLSTLSTETGNAYTAPPTSPEKGKWLMTQTYGQDLRQPE